MGDFKISYSHGAKLYYIEYGGNYHEWSIAQKMGITKRKYISILKKWGAIQDGKGYYFQFQEDAQSAIEKLEAIVIMNQLVG